ncbi:hypothetical protein AURDEDRAFT_163675 [Auricularia subglabra TFB-10046 SS5]|nr:hypothetical protein AURDEDRAFT_163675 [Auricularia subglabra TFB-10046 SS5]
MHNNFLPALLECGGLALGELLTLRIDFHTPAPFARMFWPHDPSPARVLRRLTLFAMVAQLSVESREAAFLGRALSQCARLAQDRAALELVGVKLDVPVAQVLLEETFAAVHQREFVGENSLQGQDGGLWDWTPHP